MKEPPSLETALESGEVGQGIEAACAQALGQERVNPNVGFFDLRGISVMVLEVVAELRRRWLNLRVTDIFYYPTVTQLATFLESK